MDSKNFAIGILSTTAVILLVGLVLIQSRPEPAYGFGMTAQGGDYLVTTGQLQPSQELLYILDAAHQKLNVYRFDMSRKQIALVSGEDLAKYRDAGTEDKPKPQDTQSGRRGRGRSR